ncbi:MAG TPA: group II intron reverse transcriptase/maturase [Acidobacteriota bacterium]|nr:group II intron reverse transcriptase/maturase [Acidobacteriota bacterium]
MQRKLYQWSRENTDQPYRELWNWITDPRNLRCAWRRVAANKGRRTPGVDGATVGSIRRKVGEAAFLDGLRLELRKGSYRPSPSRRKLIPKRGRPGKFRPLGIPTITDRVVQCAVKQILEPIFEAGFCHVSYGFRPGRGCHGALEHIRMSIRPRATAADGLRRKMPYQWVIEGDIKSCFDHIDHHSLMQRVRSRVSDRKVNRLLVQFLKAGVLAEEQFLRTPYGTPQGGIISPLLANIALSAIEDRYERWVHHRSKIRKTRKSDGITAAVNARQSDRQAGRPVYFPFRYADDFVVLVAGSRKEAEAEKEALADFLFQTLRLELSPEKTRITALTDGFEFLGHRIRMRWDPRFGYTPRVEIPKAAIADLRRRVKHFTGRDRTLLSLSRQLQTLNPILRGWSHFYRYCTNAKRFFTQLDWYVGDRLWRWMRKKYPKAGARRIAKGRGRASQGNSLVWKTDQAEQFLMRRVPVRRYQRGWMRTPDYATTAGEPDA